MLYAILNKEKLKHSRTCFVYELFFILMFYYVLDFLIILILLIKLLSKCVQLQFYGYNVPENNTRWYYVQA